jgi:Phage tail protein (Tail_P2_I)
VITKSKYIERLPEVLREQGDGLQVNFLNRFLAAFESVLDGDPSQTLAPDPTANNPARGLEQLLDQAELYFDPFRAPPEFLNWLATWVSVELEPAIDWYGVTDYNALQRERPQQLQPLPADRESRNRKLIQRALQLYKLRGTRAGLVEYLRVYAGDTNVVIREFTDEFIVGETTVVGGNVMIYERPYYFQVEIIATASTREELDRYIASVRKIIDREKPAHTTYDIFLEVPSLQIAIKSTIGQDTLIGGLIVDQGDQGEIQV